MILPSPSYFILAYFSASGLSFNKWAQGDVNCFWHNFWAWNDAWRYRY